MANDLADLVAALKQDQQIKRTERKEDEIMSWMRDHWSFFAPTRKQFQLAMSQLGDVFPYTSEGLCAALTVPDEIQITKIPYADALKPMIDFKDSGFEQKFIDRVDKLASRQLALILVSGARSLVVTNMNIVWNAGVTVAQYLPVAKTEEIGTITIFQAKYAPLMIPGLFDNKEKYA